MGHGHGEDEPLRATLNPTRPAWLPLWGSSKYDGRADWWSELGHSDPITQSGKFNQKRTAIRERDQEWWDPVVPDGESVPGAFGIDTRKANLAVKGDAPGDLDEYQDKVMRGSSQYKAIAAKWPLSKEHPGLMVNPTLDSTSYQSKSNLAENGVFLASGLAHWRRLTSADEEVVFPWLHDLVDYKRGIWHFGPRFFNEPMDKGAVEKGLAAAKYAVLGSSVYAYGQLQSGAYSPPGMQDGYIRLRYFLKCWALSSRLPVVASFAWAVALSTSASIRKKDDVHNHWPAAALLGLTVGTWRSSYYHGSAFAFGAVVFGVFWHYWRCSTHGIQRPGFNAAFIGPNGSPILWKSTDLGSVKTPDVVY